ncbi:hypothetical protein KH5H1_68280 [Corallococcus caeni]|nr:hypothetical protein KH5H1_68280 [Corallococcus sp. KH5-1]
MDRPRSCPALPTSQVVRYPGADPLRRPNAMSCQNTLVGTPPITRRDGLATATGGDVMVRMLQEFREMQEESKEQFARTEKALRTVHMKCRVLFRKTQRLSDRVHDFRGQVDAFSQQVGAFSQQVGAFSQQVDAFSQQVGAFSQRVGAFDGELNELRDNMGELTTHVSTLTQEVHGIKSAQIRMFGQVGRALNHLADAQSSDRKRIDVLEKRMDEPGEN